MRPHLRPQCPNSVLFILLLFLAGQRCNSLAMDSPDPTIEQERLETMRRHVSEIRVLARDVGFPRKFVDQPLFRYDDLTRGYVDGTVWRLGETGRPKAIITTELHPNYGGGGPRIVCDYLSMTETRFVAKIIGEVAWNPAGSAIEMKELRDSPSLAATKAQRLFQLKKMAERFTGHQTVEGQELELRLLPRPIDRYQPTESEDSDAAIFLFVSGRNPGILITIEATETMWQYGVGRLSQPSSLSLELDGEAVWQVRPATLDWSGPYTATNFTVFIPGLDRK